MKNGDILPTLRLEGVRIEDLKIGYSVRHRYGDGVFTIENQETLDEIKRIVMVGAHEKKYGPIGRRDWTSDKYRLPAEARYEADPVFRSLVDVIGAMLERDQSRTFTPTEVREAAMLACIRYEAIHIKPRFSTDLP